MGRGRRLLPHTHRATCHPTRWAVQGDQCADCAIPEGDLLLLPPERPMPTRCPHCGATAPTWHCDVFGGRCVLCGARWERKVVHDFL